MRTRIRPARTPAGLPPSVPARIECRTCGREVRTGCEPAVLWEEQGWCTDCWFQGSNRVGATHQQVPLCRA